MYKITTMDYIDYAPKNNQNIVGILFTGDSNGAIYKYTIVSKNKGSTPN